MHKISVIMSVYNGEAFLKYAIMSILNQTCSDFEFIIIDDGSTDDSKKIIERFHDDRIMLISRENRGLVASLNEGLLRATGKYIARMDADDYAESRRLEMQAAFLEEHPDVAMCGTFAKKIDAYGNDIGTITAPETHEQIMKTIFWHNPFIHPSVMMRRSIINAVGSYDPRFRHAEDYELWSRIVPKYKTANIPHRLIQYRIISTGVTRSKNLRMRIMALYVRILVAIRILSSYF